MLHTDINTLNLIFINYIQDVLKGSTLGHQKRIEKKFCFSLQFSFNSHGVIVKNYKYQILKFEKHCLKETYQTRDCLKEIQQPSLTLSQFTLVDGTQSLGQRTCANTRNLQEEKQNSSMSRFEVVCTKKTNRYFKTVQIINRNSLYWV